MSEFEDSTAVMEEPTEAPASDETVFGVDDTDFEELDTPSEESEPTEEQPENNAQTEEEKASGLRLQDYTRKTQDLAEERRQFAAEREAMKAETQQMQAQLQQMIQSAQVPQQLQADSLTGRLQQVASNPNLSAEDRAGLTVIAQMAETLEAQKEQIERLSQATSQFEQTSQAVQGLTQAQTQAQVSALREQINEATEMFGQETVSQTMGFVRRNGMVGNQWSPEVNPQTGQPFTIPELVALGSGKLAEDRQGAVAANRNGRQTAKRAASTNGRTSGTPESGWSKDDALAVIRGNQT